MNYSREIAHLCHIYKESQFSQNIKQNTLYLLKTLMFSMYEFKDDLPLETCKLLENLLL